MTCWDRGRPARNEREARKDGRQLKVRGAGDSIEPGVERSETPGSFNIKTRRVREAADSGSITTSMVIRLSAASRALDYFESDALHFSPAAGNLFCTKLAR